MFIRVPEGANRFLIGQHHPKSRRATGRFCAFCEVLVTACRFEEEIGDSERDRCGLNYSDVCALGSWWVIGANMQCKLLVALQHEVAHHFIERCAGGRTRRFEPPATLGATKTEKTLLLNPYQLHAHGRVPFAATVFLRARFVAQGTVFLTSG